MRENTTFDGKSRHVTEDRPVPLYVAHFEKERGTILLRDGGRRGIPFSGEILVVQSSDQQTLGIREIRRVSLWIESVEEMGGLVSFAGPANEIAVKPGPDGIVEPFDMRFYYPILSDLEPACEESDAWYSQLETLRGRLSWGLEDASDEKVLRMQVTVTLDKLIDRRKGADAKDAVEGLTFGPVVLLFQRLEEQKFISPQANSLTSCGNSPPSGGSHDQRALRLRFVNLSRIWTSPTDLANLETMVQGLIDSACEVWWEKGGIKIEPHPSGVVTPTPSPSGFPCAGGTSGFCVSYAQESSVASISADGNAVEIYLADRLTGDSSHPRTGGGITKNCGTSGAYVILEIGKAENNKYLLAHELGHVLGLSHPDQGTGSGCAGFPAGSYCSVMVPDSPNSSRNTAHNLTTLAMPLGPVFTQLLDPSGAPLKCGLKDCDPKHFYHIIRDFPYDDGTEDSVPQPPFTNWWSHSDVWNSDKPPKPGLNKDNLYNDNTPMFAPDHSPNHTEPRRSGTNYMYARLHTCETLNHPVNVYLYLAVPGSASHPLTLLPTPSGINPLVFSNADGSLPQADAPKTKNVQWTVPTGYPAHCCVFAVGQSDNEVTPSIITQIINNPGSHNFYSLFNRLKSDNDVAQRNLYIQETMSSSGASSWSWLSWVEMSNPFDRTDAAHLEIDTTLASGLENLILEVNGQPLSEIEVGSSIRVPLTDALRPEDRLILRFKAKLPPGVPQGTTFPIDLRFFVGDQLTSGYQHVLRVAPVSKAVVQVMDTLFGALRDVDVGFKSDVAQDLAGDMRKIVLKAQEMEAPRGCWGMIKDILRLESWNWQAEWNGLTGRFAALAQSLEKRTDIEPECQAVCQHLRELAELSASADTASPNLLIEQIRDRADRIQEQAGRVARRLQ